MENEFPVAGAKPKKKSDTSCKKENLCYKQTLAKQEAQDALENAIIATIQDECKKFCIWRSY